MSAKLLAVEQRAGRSGAQAWVLDGEGRRMPGHDHDERLLRMRDGLTRHDAVRTFSADASTDTLQETVAALHEPSYLLALGSQRAGEPALLKDFAAPGMAPDTPVSAEVVACAFEGVRTAITAAERIVAGARYAYALCRPPGHHAGPAWVGGCCYLNNAAAAAHTLSGAGAGPVAILDLDIHYPNGTSAIAEHMQDTSLASLHASPVVNSPSLSADPKTVRERLIAFSEPPTDDDYLAALAGEIEVLAGSAAAIVLSLGYDTVRGDPHGCWSFSPRTFARMGHLLASTELPICVVQEGGYELESLAACSFAFAAGLLGSDGA
jgi:acetoin utilization deacetylase AcuC-like enzyme